MTDLKNLTSFSNRDFRNAYMSGRIRTYIALQLHELRDSLNLTQAQFAKKIGKPQSVVARLENTEYGRVTLKTLLDIAEALDIGVMVKFAGFDEFLYQHGDVSPAALAVETYDETVSRFTIMESEAVWAVGPEAQESDISSAANIAAHFDFGMPAAPNTYTSETFEAPLRLAVTAA